ncbi:hypothetical protein Q0F99_12435 [Rathayibacter oskolensis]|uniref:hypothetical protein n=1 Tax=Rathayibacter oskolensis TaxID=1891671 RepID=UPI00265F38D4|nr:hypothetical protein [Rathayibacter oskolensis]WKK70642.1 hypothetical protein Q0F99_12435 [Rathayibacter oskolensis]
MTPTLQDSGWLWLGLAIVTAGLAEQKGRSRWRWFVLELFLGPLATALVVIWARPESGPTDIRWNFAVGSWLAAAALVLVAATTGSWLLLIPALVVAGVAGLLTWLSRRVPFESLRR